MAKSPDSSSTGGDEVTLHPPDLNIDTIMAAIRHGWAGDAPQAAYFSESKAKEMACLEEAFTEDYKLLLSFLLRELNQTHAPRFQIEADLTPSRLDKLPLIGLLWHNLRRQLHNLAIFYANKVARQVGNYHLRLATILSLMAHQHHTCDNEMVELKQRLAQLEATLAQLEHKR